MQFDYGVVSLRNRIIITSRRNILRLHELFSHSKVSKFFSQKAHENHVINGATNLRLARTIVGIMGVHSPEEILELDADEMALLMAGDESVIAQKPNYLTDPIYKGMFDRNPYYVAADKKAIKPQNPQRNYIRPKRPNFNIALSEKSKEQLYQDLLDSINKVPKDSSEEIDLNDVNKK